MEPSQRFDLPSSAYPSPPASPGKRRRRLRESENTQGEMPIEFYLYRSDPYRKSSFKTPLPLPFFSEDPPRMLQLDGDRIRPHVPAIFEILKNNSFQKSQFYLKMALISKPGYPDGNIKHLALVLYINQGNHIMTSTWTRARDEIVRMFAVQGLSQIKVEMFDRDRAFMPSLFPVRSQDPSIRCYKAARQELLERIGSRLGKFLQSRFLQKCWRAMSVFNLGPGQTTAKPTLVIFVKPGLLRDWKAVEAELLHILGKYSDMQIEFLPGNVSDLPGGQNDVPQLSFLTKLGQFPVMGTSIGVVREPGAGTLGGFVRLECNEKVYSGILTNHHVVLPVSKSQDVIDSLNQHGYGKVAAAPTTLIQYPAADDLRADILRSEADRIAGQQALDESQEKLDRFKYKGQNPPETLRQIYRSQEAYLKRTEAHQSTLEELPITLGRVLYSSGDVISGQGSIIDWAFVELQHAAAIPEKNKLPSAETLEILDRRAVYDLPSYASLFAEIEKDQWYFKVGRTTAITTGICHGIEVDVQRESQVRYDETGRKVVLKTNSTRELLIMNHDPAYLGGGGFAKGVCKPGDFGSFLYNAYGQVAGLVYGEIHGQVGPNDSGKYCVNSELATSMGEILASIKAKTGGKLRLV